MPSRGKAPHQTRTPVSRETLLRQVRDLRRRFADSERRREEAMQTLEAIRTGGVDALVVASPEGERIFTLQGAEQPYRLLIETVNAAALTVDLDGVVLYANAQTATMLGLPLERVLGARLDSWIAPDDRPTFARLFTAACTGEAAGDLHVLPRGTTLLPVHVALRRFDTPELQAVCLVLSDLSERQRAEAVLRQANEQLEARVAERTAALRDANARLAAANVFLHAILDQAAEEIIVRDAGGRLLLANAAVRRYARGSLDGTGVEQIGAVLGPPLDRDGREIPREAWPVVRALKGERGAALEVVRPASDRERRVLLVTASPIYGTGQELLGAVSVSADITELTRREAELRSAVADRETLLREVHHRVKNNLQILCDLLYLQMERLEDEQGAVLRDTYGRIYAVARLHEQLYQAMQSGRVALRDYLGRLVEGFRAIYSTVPVRVEGVEAVTLDLDRAIHVGLLVNELVTNALKHAFPRGHEGEVVVRLTLVGESLELVVRDNGRGLSADLDLEQTKSLGLRIVSILAKRLQATVTITNENGVTFTLLFPLQAEPLVEPQ